MNTSSASSKVPRGQRTPLFIGFPRTDDGTLRTYAREGLLLSRTFAARSSSMGLRSDSMNDTRFESVSRIGFPRAQREAHSCSSQGKRPSCRGMTSIIKSQTACPAHKSSISLNGLPVWVQRACTSSSQG